MKILKKILIGIVGLIALILIVAIFVKKDYSVEREIVIDKPQPEVFDYVKYLKNQDNFSVWAKRDPNMKKEYVGTDATPGFTSKWDSENDHVGKGEQEIKAIKGDTIFYELRFIKPFESTSPAYMIAQSASAAQTKVKWGFHGHMNYPMNIMLLCMDMNEMIGKDFQTGLENLKGILEKK